MTAGADEDEGLMRSVQRRFFVVVLGLLLSVQLASAKTQGQIVSPDYDSSATATIRPLYSGYLEQNRGLQVQAAAIGKIEIVRFLIGGNCPPDGCYTTVVTEQPDGKYRQIFALKTRSVTYYHGTGAFPVLRVNGMDWDYTFANGYIADIKSAGEAFVPTLRPQGQTADEIGKALSSSGWPNGVLPLVHEVQPGAEAPTTLLVIPDMTTTLGQQDCAAGSCHVWFLVYVNGSWKASTGTTGTGLLAVLPPDAQGIVRIGVAETAGFFTFSWSVQDSRWEQTGSTFSAVPRQNSQ